MIESARGVVLRTQRLTETSLIARWLTRETGRLTTVARGAHRPKSAYAGKLDLFVVADITFRRSKRSDLHILGEISPVNFHLPLREDVRRLQMASYCTTLLEQTTESDTPLPGLFELFTESLEQIAVSEIRPRLVFSFELKLLDALGLSPALANTGLKPASRELAIKLTKGNWAEIGELNPSKSSVKEMNNFLHGFLIYHLGKIPRNRSEALGLAGAAKSLRTRASQL